MCAEDIMQVTNCSTPANYYHTLRRPLSRDIRKPLIMMAPEIAAAPFKRASRTVADTATKARRSTRLLLDIAEAN